MRIAVLSDTHSKRLPTQLIDDLHTVDLIVHAGDFCAVKDYQFLAAIKEVKAVSGNMDTPQVRALLPRRLLFTFCGHTFGLFHGRGPAQTICTAVEEEFKNDTVEWIIFGHSHNAMNKKIKGVTYFNPGSPTDTIFAPFCSYGIIEVTDDALKAEIIKIRN